MIPIILAIATGLYLFLFAVVILLFSMRDRRRIEFRLKDLFHEDVSKNRPIQIKKVQQQKIPISRSLANQLVAADVRMRPEEYLIVWILSAATPALLLLVIGAHPVTILGGAIIGAGLPPYFVNRKMARRLVQFESQLSEALVMISNCLKSGLTFQQAMGNIASEMPDPISREFGRTMREINLGSSVETAMANLAERVKSTDLSLAVSAIQIQRQVGGNMVELLDNISETIKDRIKIKNEIKVLTASGRTSGMIIGLLPLGLAGVLMLINPEYIASFFSSQMGAMMLVTGAVMESIGFLAIKKIVSIKY